MHFTSKVLHVNATIVYTNTHYDILLKNNCKTIQGRTKVFLKRNVFSLFIYLNCLWTVEPSGCQEWCPTVVGQQHRKTHLLWCLVTIKRPLHRGYCHIFFPPWYIHKWEKFNVFFFLETNLIFMKSTFAIKFLKSVIFVSARFWRNCNSWNLCPKIIGFGKNVAPWCAPTFTQSWLADRSQLLSTSFIALFGVRTASER